MTRFLSNVDELALQVADGVVLAVPPDYSGCAMAAVRALIRRGARDLHLLGVPQVGFQGDMLIGAGCVKTLETAALTLGGYSSVVTFSNTTNGAGTTRRKVTLNVLSPGGSGILASTLSQFGVTWTFDKEYEVGQFANGDPWVVGPVALLGRSRRLRRRRARYHTWWQSTA